MTAPPPPGVPLARLLVMAGRSMIDELHVRLRADGWDGIRPAYGFVLVALKSRTLTNSALAAELDVSKQATSKLVDAMVAGGLVERTVDPADSRIRRLSLTPTGERLLADVERIYVDLESDWAAIIGERSLRRIGRGLTDVLLAVHDGSFPPIRPA